MTAIPQHEVREDMLYKRKHVRATLQEQKQAFFSALSQIQILFCKRFSYKFPSQINLVKAVAYNFLL